MKVAQKISFSKLPSITRRLKLGHEVTLSPDIIPLEGNVVIVEALDERATNNVLEHSNGRLGSLKQGDVIPGVFGRRRALREFSGHVPEQVAAGDVLHLLCESGVVGALDGHNESWGSPLAVRVLGAALGDDGEPLNIKQEAVPHQTDLPASAPIIAILGTSMDSGKTTAAIELIKFLTGKGLKVAAAKLAGVAFMQDPLKLQDAGAWPVMDLLDAGIPSTCNNPDDALGAALGVLAEINKSNPDLIVVEFGDGILGEYNVGHMLSSQALTQHITACIVAAGDLVGVWGAQQLLANYGLQPTTITGLAVNNQTATEYIQEHFGIPAESNQHGMPATKELLWSILSKQPAILQAATDHLALANGHVQP